jgi:hypothetical protein
LLSRLVEQLSLKLLTPAMVTPERLPRLVMERLLLLLQAAVAASVRLTLLLPQQHQVRPDR